MIRSGCLKLQRSSRLLWRAGDIRHLASVQHGKHFDVVIVGAGPAGLTCASVLLDQGLKNICILDPKFTGGRINDRYREVPSNTKAGLFVQWATGTNTFSEILSKVERGDALDKLQSFNPDEGCQLTYAIDVAQLLSDGLRDDSRVTSILSTVRHLSKHGDVWDLPQHRITTDRVVLAPGAHPRSNPVSENYPNIASLDLDTVLKPSSLRNVVPAQSKLAVIGSSHSAVLALKNIYELGNNSIVNFYRSPLLYAIYKDGWILYDNTGLKGVAAEWAKEMLDVQHHPPNLRRVDLRDSQRSEKEIYDAELKGCTHIVSAIGYETNELPRIEVDKKQVKPEFDPLSGRFFIGRNNQKLLGGLYGAGIAFPELVTDPKGNVESAVGWFKFMKFLRRVGPSWAEATR